MVDFVMVEDDEKFKKTLDGLVGGLPVTAAVKRKVGSGVLLEIDYSDPKDYEKILERAVNMYNFQ